MADDINIIGLCGSLRQGSYNAALQRALPELAPANMRISPAPSYREFPMLDMDIVSEQGVPAPVITLAEAIRAADGLIITTPEYNYSVPGVLKNAIDWVSRVPGQAFAGKPVLLQSAATGLLGGVRAHYHLRQSMVFLECLVMNKPEVFVSQAATRFDADTLALTDAGTRDLVGQQLAAFGEFVKRMKVSQDR